MNERINKRNDHRFASRSDNPRAEPRGYKVRRSHMVQRHDLFEQDSLGP